MFLSLFLSVYIFAIWPSKEFNSFFISVDFSIFLPVALLAFLCASLIISTSLSHSASHLLNLSHAFVMLFYILRYFERVLTTGLDFPRVGGFDHHCSKVILPQWQETIVQRPVFTTRSNLQQGIVSLITLIWTLWIDCRFVFFVLISTTLEEMHAIDVGQQPPVGL